MFCVVAILLKELAEFAELFLDAVAVAVLAKSGRNLKRLGKGCTISIH